jgi:hypothetical protein
MIKTGALHHEWAAIKEGEQLTMKSKTVTGNWIVEETTELNELVIEDGGSLEAPEGKVLALSVDGMGYEAKPGYYFGDVVITVAEPYLMQPACIFRESGRVSRFRSAVTVIDGEIVTEQSMTALVVGGEVTGTYARGFSIQSIDPSFNGIILDGNTDFTIENAKIGFEGKGVNDFEGAGAGVTAIGNTKLLIKDSEITLSSQTRCTIHAGGNSNVRVKDCRITNDSPETGMEPAWMLGLRGTNRAIQLCDKASISFESCVLKGNGWGVLSVDGPEKVRMSLKDCLMELSGPRARGYGAFVFGDCKAEFDHTVLNVKGYPILQSTENGLTEIKNGSRVIGDHYGAVIFKDESGEFILSGKSSMKIGRACFVVKGARTSIVVEDSAVESKQGVILQLMDNDEPGVTGDHFEVPVGEVDTPVEDRDLTTARVGEDVFFTVRRSDLKGDFLNSSTELRANLRTPAGSHFDLNDDALNETMEGKEMLVDEEFIARENAGQGAKNLLVRLEMAGVTGRISAAIQKYRYGLERIDEKTKFELSNVTQTPAPPVNNGVIVYVDRDSKWIVTGKCWLTALEIEEGGVVVAEKMTVNGEVTPIAAGSYRGLIVIE